MITDLALKYRFFVIAAIHLALIFFSNTLSFLLRFDWTIPELYLSTMWKTLPVVLLVRFAVFHFMGIHHGAWRYASIRDLVNIVKAVTLSSVILVLVLYFFLRIHSYPRSVFIMDWAILILLMGGARMQWRIFRELKALNIGGKKRILLVGAGDAGEMILREIMQNPNLPYQPIGFIDDDSRKRGLKIHGVPVLGSRKEIHHVVGAENIEEIIITISSARASTMQDIVSDCNKTGVPLKTVPGFGQIVQGQVSVSQIRDVRLEDLLYREVVKTDTGHIGGYLKDKTVLITGAAGSIGSELCRQIGLYRPRRIILFDQAESSLYFTTLDLERRFPDLPVTSIIGDLVDEGRVHRTVEEFKPDVVFHSAAYKHVPILENSPSEAVRNNLKATRNIARASNEFSVERFVLISTDKAVNPTSVMGATKRLAELYIQELAKTVPSRFVIVRFGNVMGSNGSVIPLFRMQIEEGGPVTVTHRDVTRYFMTISEAVQLVLQASVMGTGGEIFVLDMGEQVRIVDLARHMISLSGFEPDEDIRIVFTGLRAGEKLYEELFDRSEDVEDTAHEKIKKAVTRESSNMDQWSRRLDELEGLAEKGLDKEILTWLGEAIPAYGKSPVP